VQNKAIPDGTACRFHGGASPHVASKAPVRAEVFSWGLGDSHVDPGAVLLRLVTQSAARAQRYAMLLEEAYEAAERLKRSFDAGAVEIDEGNEMAETAREDLDRIFNTGGVAALVGNTYGAAKDVVVYVTGEAIRGLADLAKGGARTSSGISPSFPSRSGFEKCPYARSPDLHERGRIGFLLLQELAELLRRRIREVDALTSDAKPGMALPHGEQLNI
jgi:hypothetical protein